MGCKGSRVQISALRPIIKFALETTSAPGKASRTGISALRAPKRPAINSLQLVKNPVGHAGGRSQGHFAPGSHGSIDTESQAGRADEREAVDSCVSRLGWCWLAENAPSSIGEVIRKERCSEGLTVHRDVQTAPRTAAGMSTANEVTTHASGGPLVDIIHRLSNRRDVDGAECSARQDDGARWVQEASRSPGHA
jgi:hypothetical protein